MATVFISATLRVSPGNILGRVRNMEQAALRGVQNGIRETVLFTSARAKENLTDIGAVDRGELRASVTEEITVSPDRVVGRVFSGAKHGPWVEYGRRGLNSTPANVKHSQAAKAAWPPIRVIVEWVRRNYRKLKPAGVTKSGRTRKPKDNQIARAAFLIARKIAYEGIAARPWLTPAYELGRKKLLKNVRRGIEQELKVFGKTGK